MTEVVALLRELGFAEYEAKAYVALLQRSPLNGYALAKASGVPRADVYAVLRRLEERGAVVRLDIEDSVRYAPVPAEQIIERLQSRFETTLDAARRSLQSLSVPAEPEYIWNARGYPALLEHARAMVDGASERLLAALVPQEAIALAGNLAQAESRGVKITTLCLQRCPEPCGGCRGHLYRFAVPPESNRGWLVLVADQAEMLAAEVGDGDGTLAVRTRQRLLVELASWYIRHSIALAAMVGDLGDRIEGLVAPETLAVLSAAEEGGSNAGWLEQVRGFLLNQEPTNDTKQGEV